MNTTSLWDKGHLESGYRTILLTNIICFSQNSNGYFKKIKDLLFAKFETLDIPPTLKQELTATKLEGLLEDFEELSNFDIFPNRFLSIKECFKVCVSCNY